MRRGTWVLTVAIAILMAPGGSRAGVLFFEDFAGPSLNPALEPTLPDDARLSIGYGPIDYLGAPSYAFQTLDGNSVIRLTNTMGDRQRRGWMASPVLSSTNFRYEARFNTLNQTYPHSIDAFLEIWIIDALDPTLYNITSPYSSNYGADPTYGAGSTLDNLFNYSSYPYQSNTWYRLVLDGSTGGSIRASLRSDLGIELIGYTLGHTAAAFANGFRIGLSQAIGAPTFPCQTDVAIDFIRVTGDPVPSVVPEPSGFVLAVFGVLGLIAARTRACLIPSRW